MANAATPEQTCVLLESASYALLVLLEELTPNQRAVFLLREVYELNTDETAHALQISPSNVKTTLHRARKVLAERSGPPAMTGEVTEHTSQLLAQLLDSLTTRDIDRLRALMAEDVELISDAGGAFVAARRPLAGRRKVATFLHGLAQQSSEMLRPPEVTPCFVNGLPAVIIDIDPPPPRRAPRTLLSMALDESHHIRSLYLIMAPEKLNASPWTPPPAAGRPERWR